MFKTLSKLKRQQLELLEEAVSLLCPKPLRGSELWGGALPKENILRLLDIVEEIRAINGIRGKRTNDVSAVRKSVQEFDEAAYQERIHAGWLRRIAPLIEHGQRETDRVRPPSIVRELYWRKGLSAQEIGNRFRCSKQAILKQMARCGIPRRDEDEARRIHYGLDPIKLPMR